MMGATDGGHDIGHAPTTTQTTGVEDLVTHKMCLFLFSVSEFLVVQDITSPLDCQVFLQFPRIETPNALCYNMSVRGNR